MTHLFLTSHRDDSSHKFWLEFVILSLLIFSYTCSDVAATSLGKEYCGKPFTGINNERKKLLEEQNCPEIAEAILEQNSVVRQLVISRKQICSAYQKDAANIAGFSGSQTVAGLDMCALFDPAKNDLKEAARLLQEHRQRVQIEQSRAAKEIKRISLLTRDAINSCYSSKSWKKNKSGRSPTGENREGRPIVNRKQNSLRPSYEGMLSDEFRSLFLKKYGYFKEKINLLKEENGKADALLSLAKNETTSLGEKRELCATEPKEAPPVTKPKEVVPVKSAGASTKDSAQRVTNEVRSKAHSSSTGMCLQYVRKALFRAELLPYDRPLTENAQDAGPKLESFGFRNIINQVGRDPYKAPAGAVLIYSGGPAGHAEIRGTDGRFYSDFAQKGPGSTWGRRLIGIYVK